MIHKTNLGFWAVLFTLTLSLAACSGQHQSQPTSSSVGSGDVLVTINGTPLTRKDLNDGMDTRNRMRLYQAENQYYRSLQGVLDGAVQDRLLEMEAKKHGISKEELLKREVEEKIPKVSDAEVNKMYKERETQIKQIFKQRYKNQKMPSEAEIKESLKGQLAARKKGERSQTYLAKLQSKYKVEYHMAQPEPPRVEVGTGPNPKMMGSKDAKVTIIAFSDFECPYCMRAVPTIHEIEKEYGNEVQIVFRDFPLSFHATAQKQAEAASCAHDQGKFWPYHDKLFTQEAQQKIKSSSKQNQGKGLETALTAMATEIGLDGGKFSQCLSSGEKAQRVQADLQAGQEAGINSTPSFVVNGRLVAGAQPFSEFKKIIDEELKAN